MYAHKLKEGDKMPLILLMGPFSCTVCAVDRVDPVPGNQLLVLQPGIYTTGPGASVQVMCLAACQLKPDTGDGPPFAVAALNAFLRAL